MQMKTKHDIEKRLSELLNDERLDYPDATVFENAPLALTQLSIKTEIRTLLWMLNYDGAVDLKSLREKFKDIQ